MSDEEFELQTKREFAFWARHYDSKILDVLYFSRFRKKIFELIDATCGDRMRKGVRCLDIACGTGEIAIGIAKRYPQSSVTGIDFSPDMLMRARAKSGGQANLVFAETGAIAMPFADNAFDFVICSDSLHHFTDPSGIFREVRRVLKPEGYFLLADPAADTMLLKIALAFFGMLETAKKYYSAAEALGRLSESGFRARLLFRYLCNNFYLAEKSRAD